MVWKTPAASWNPEISTISSSCGVAASYAARALRQDLPARSQAWQIASAASHTVQIAVAGRWQASHQQCVHTPHLSQGRAPRPLSSRWAAAVATAKAARSSKLSSRCSRVTSL